MGIFGNFFDKSKRAREATDTIAPAWKLIADKNPEMDGFDIARAIVTMRPKQYQDSYKMLLDMDERVLKRLDPNSSCTPKKLIKMLINVEITSRFNIEIDGATEMLWDDTITEELGKYGLATNFT